MICNKCFHTKTSVTNSRSHKKTPQIWRRRQCQRCGNTFSTYERVNLADELIVKKGTLSEPYNNGVLLMSIHDALVDSDTKPAQNAYWLARSIEDDLVLMGDEVTSGQIKEKAHAALSRFDTLAGIHYALKHQIMDQIKRPRRRF